MMPDQYTAFREHVERQSMRAVKRCFDYGKRVRQHTGLTELTQWVGRILLDEEGIYVEDERAQAFLVGACEQIAPRWVLEPMDALAAIVVVGGVDRVRLLRMLLDETDRERLAGLQQALADHDPRLAAWIAERAAALDPGGPTETEPAMRRFLDGLEAVDPLRTGPVEDLSDELEEAQQQQERLRRELAAATDRAERAVSRLEALEEEVKSLRRSVRDERENGEKLRQERSRRIKLDREAREAATQLDRLKQEYVKLDARLRESVRRQPDAPPPLLEQLRSMPASELLGVPADAGDEAIGQARRRFAGAFHSDRAGQLPAWVADLFDHLLGLVNDACDRARR